MRLYHRLFICAVVLACLALNAEEIQLNDGTKVIGKITNVSGEVFKVRTSYGEIQIPRAHIVSISFPDNRPKEDPKASESGEIDEAIDGNKYVNRTVGMQINLAKDWTTAPKMASGDIKGALKSADETLFLFVTPEKFVGTINTYKVLVETKLQGTFSDFEKLSDTEVQIDGKSANRVIWRGKNKSANNTPVKALVYIVPYEGRVVRLSFITLDQLFDGAVPTFESMAQSYRTIQ